MAAGYEPYVDSRALDFRGNPTINKSTGNFILTPSTPDSYKFYAKTSVNQLEPLFVRSAEQLGLVVKKIYDGFEVTLPQQ